MFKRNIQQGFTLIELSIVIVIIGLIVSGIVGGKTLVHQAALRSVISDLEEFQVAFNTFELEYNAIPGDINNAHYYWGSACASAADNCNGDGNKNIGTSGLHECTGDADDCEPYRAWQHLHLAGLIGGNFTGVGEGTGREAVSGINTPVMAFKPAGPIPGSTGDPVGTYSFRTMDYSYISPSIGSNPMAGSNHLIVGTNNPNFFSNQPLFIPEEAKAIDIKVDDGAVNSGKVLGHRGNGVSNDDCITGGSFSAAVYNLSTRDVACALQVAMD